MKVLLVNGSPHEKGSTYTALSEVAKTLNAEGVDTEFFWIGTGPQRGCIGCEKCSELDQCVFDDDKANRLLEAMREADGFVLGSPVYFAGPNGALCAMLDRAFYAGRKSFEGKVASAMVNCRRAGATAALDRLFKYLTYGRLTVATSQYWNMTHGNSAEEVVQDAEGMQIMRTLGTDMAFLLKATQGEALPPRENQVWTNFIR
ncbi:flavodoxin family protein [Ruminococcaceae bacterium OttesenSCG-928-D13]|nr:flavodoxin family protein [Ruminococcaceae bacterium OttesenSCG-928-D13]